MFLSPSLSQISLDFCLQSISSKSTHFLYMSFASFFASFSSSVNPLSSSRWSQSSNWFRASVLLISNLQKLSLFQALIKFLTSFNFQEKKKLVVPRTVTPCHQPLSKSWKPSTFNHIFSNLKGIWPLLIFPHSSKMGA